MKTKAAQARDTRKRLERVGRHEFGAQGFSAVSAEEIVAAAGVTRGALYHHYGGKEELFAAVVELVMKELHENLVAAGARAKTPPERLRMGLLAFFKGCADPAVNRILLQDAPTVLGWHRWREMDSKYGLGLLKQTIAGTMQVGSAGSARVDLIAHVVLGAMIEAAMIVAHAKEHRQTADEAANVLMMLFSGLSVDH